MILPRPTLVLRVEAWLQAPPPSFIRAAVVIGVAVHLALGFALLPQWMFSKYPDFARLLLDGRLNPEEGADVSPLYLLINAGVGPMTLRFLQSLLGAAGVVASFFLARALSGPLAGVVALALAAVASPFLLYEATLEPDLLIAVMNAGALALLAMGIRQDRWGAAAAAGALLGVSAALRPSNLLLIPVAAAWLAWSARAGGWRAALRPALALALTGGLLAVVPLALIRATAGQQFAATMSAGEMLHICNRPEGSGLGYQSPALVKLVEQQEATRERPDLFHAIYRRFARAAEGATLTPVQCERYWAEQVGAFVTREPLAFASLQARKLGFLLIGASAHDLSEVRAADRGLPAFLPSFRALTFLGVAGLLLSLFTRRTVGPTGPYLAVVVTTTFLFCVSSRYALLTVPVWCALGGGFLVAVGRGLLRPRTLGWCLLAGALPLALGALPFARDASSVIERGASAGAAMTQLATARSAGDTPGAWKAFVEAQGAQPFVRWSRDLRGVPFESEALALASAAQSTTRFGAERGVDAYFQAKLLALGGRCEEALGAADRAAQAGFYAAVWDLSLDPDLLAAECALQRGDRPAATQRIARSLAARPGTLSGLALAAALARTTGQERGPFEQELFALHDPLSAGFAFSEALLAAGDAAGALDQADLVLRHLPEAGVVLHLRARALVALGREGEALDTFARALVTFPAHAHQTRPFEAPLRRALAAGEPSAALLALAAETEARAGRIAAARQWARRAIQAYGERAPAELRATQRWLEAARDEPSPIPQQESP